MGVGETIGVRPGNSVAKFQLPLFVALAYLLSWWSAPFSGGQIIPYGPSIAAVIVVALAAGRPGLRVFWRRVTNWRAAWYWYAGGPAIIAGYHSLAWVLLALLGTPQAAAPALSTGIFLELLLLGGQWEEPGWTGYLLPFLQRRYGGRPNGYLLAILAAGLVRSIWHLPLFLNGHLPWFDIFVFAFAMQAIVAWLYNRSGGSVPVVFVFHFASNLFGAAFYPVYAGPERLLFQAIFMGLACVAALAVVRYARPGETAGP